MKKLKIVYKYEFLNIVKKKAFRIVTVILSLIFFSLSFIPMIVSKVNFKDGASKKEVHANYGIVYFDKNIIEMELTKYPPFDTVKRFATEEELNRSVNEADIEAGLVLLNSEHFMYVVKDEDIRMPKMKEFKEALKLYNRNEVLKKAGISLEVVDKVENLSITTEIKVLGKSGVKNIPMAYIGIFLMYILTISYGAVIASSVAKEKSNRTMELLITSCDPTSLIVGKVFASMTSILLQVGFFLMSFIIGIIINKGYFSKIFIDILKTSITIESIFALIVFGILGYIMYAFILAALGALVSKVEDVNGAMLPVTFLFILSYLIANTGMTMPDNMMLRIASIVPITAPLCMFVRSTLTSVPPIEFALSVVLVVVATVGLAWISIKIYRMGTLNYGNKIRLFKALKIVFSK